MISEPIPPSPPSKANLRAWWNHFTFAQRLRKEAEAKEAEQHTVFGKPLSESLRYASVQISTANPNGELYVWGYIPVVVAKCGLYLKENATEIEGTFRVNGSAKRMRELQAAFEQPPRYGKSLDWKQETYTPHDVASVFRRYLTQMPEPVIPHDMYYDFRDPLAKQPVNTDEAVTTYKRLIRNMPRPNQYLLLYVLDLLSVFARKSDKNLMTAANLAVIFRPALISHPKHEMSPQDHALSQQVLEFLIAQQDWFMLDVPPPPPINQNPSSPTDSDDITVFPNSDDEKSGAEGWKLISSQRRISRRRTTVDSTTSPTEETPALSPVDESGTVATQGATGVTRSRTLPSQRGSDHEHNVLRKKRASSSQPKTAKGGGATSTTDPPAS